MLRLVQLAAAVASLASISQAFLLPPSVPAHALDSVSLDPLQNMDETSVAIVCPGCPVSTIPYSAETKSVLRFNVSVSRGKHGDALLLNGFQAYPFNPLSDVYNRRPFTADQLVKTPTGTWQYADSPDLGWAISIAAPVEPAGPAGNPLNIVKMRVRILDVGGRAISNMFALEIKLLETPSGALMLGELQVVPPPAPNPVTGCSTMLCIIKDKLAKLRGGCAGMRRPGRPHHGQTKNPAHANSHDGHEHSHRPHHFQSHHHHQHTGFMRYLRIAVVRILIPVMFGVVFGATACVVGIVTGHLAVCIWRAVFRRGERCTYIRAESDDADDDEAEDETKGFLAHQDAPPVYEHAPVYEEVITSPKASE